MFTDDKVDEPRHLSTGKCLCQFVEQHFRSTPSGTPMEQWETEAAAARELGQLADLAAEEDELANYDDEFGQSDTDDEEAEEEEEEEEEGEEEEEEEEDDEEEAQWAHEQQFADDCCSTDELTDMMLGSKQLQLAQQRTGPTCLQLDIGKLAAVASSMDAPASLRILMPDQVGLGLAARRPDCLVVPTLSATICERRASSISPANTELSFNTADELDSAAQHQALIRKHELMGKLKELLERRKRQMAGASSTGPSWPQTSGPTSGGGGGGVAPNLAADRQEPRESSGGGGGGRHLKKLLSQTSDGLSLLAAGKLKQNQPGFYVKQRQALEIC